MRLRLSASVLAALAAFSACSEPPRDAPPALPPPPASASIAVAPKVEPTPIELTIVGTNDLHGRIEALPLFAGYLAALRKHHTVLLLDAGDMFQGTLESNLGEGAGVVRAYDALGYDAAAIGNHEFDFGPVGPDATAAKPGDDPRGALRERAKEAKFPFLTANVVDAATGAPPAWTNVAPSVIVEKAGVRIGIVGVTSEDTPRTTIAANFSGLSIRPIAASIAREAAKLRGQGATVVVAVTHAGGRCDKLDQPLAADACSPTQELMGVLAAMPEGTVDAIVAGHTHQAMAHVIRGVPVIESWASGRAFGRIDLVIDPATKRVVDRKVHPPTPIERRGLYEGEVLAADASIAALLAPDVERARDRKERKVGVVLRGAVTRRYDVESREGNLFADLLHAARPKADVALANGGGLRADLPAGELLYGALFEAMPFDNRVALVKMKGKDLAAMAKKNLVADKGILSFSGVRVTATCAGDELRVSLARVNGKAIRDDDELLVATSDFLATGGDETAMPLDRVTIEAELLRDVFEVQLKARKAPLDPDDPTLFDPKRPRFDYPGTRPVRCGASKP